MDGDCQRHPTVQKNKYAAAFQNSNVEKNNNAINIYYGSMNSRICSEILQLYSVKIA